MMTDLLFKAGHRGGTDHITMIQLEEAVTNNGSKKEKRRLGSSCIHNAEIRSSCFNLSAQHTQILKN